MGEWKDTVFSTAFDVNPRRDIKRGRITPFIPMDALSTNRRDVERIDEREFTGSGMKFKNGDTLLARITPCLENGKTAYISSLSDDAIAHGSTEYIVIAGKHGISDGLFGYYLARSPEFRTYAIGHMEGTSGRQRVPNDAICKYRIPLPPLPEQRAIASILGTLDDKIELNRRMNETLEAMARDIFKDWFVDFGPTRAKLEGREPYLAADLWAIFPERLDDEGKPEGWCEGAISNFCNVKSGKRPPTKMTLPDYNNGVPVYGGNGVSWYTNASLFEPPFIVTGRVGTLGTVFRVYDRVWVSDNALCCFPLKKEYLEYLYFVVSVLDFNSLNSGSTQPLLTQTALQKQLAIIASDEIICAFSQIINLLFIRIEQNISENQTLAQTRDLLIPRLLSGEIRVKDVDKMVEEIS